MKKTDWHEADVALVVEMKMQGKTWVEISAKFPGSTPNAVRKLFYRETRDSLKAKPVRILLLDIETAPLEVYCWGLWDQNIGLNQIIKDISVLSWSAKWYGEKEIMYQDVRGQKNLRDDKKILKNLWELLDEADIALGQNSDRFDIPLLNARFLANGYPPPSSFRKLDTLKIAKRNFKFTSNKLEYTTSKFCVTKKLSHKKFPGFELWRECLAGNLEAFKEMEIYNKTDVTSLEEYYNKLKPWDKTINFNVYNNDDLKMYCSCGSTNFVKLDKQAATNLGRYELFRCKSCGKTHQGRENLLDKDKKQSLKK